MWAHACPRAAPRPRGPCVEDPQRITAQGHPADCSGGRRGYRPQRREHRAALVALALEGHARKGLQEPVQGDPLPHPAECAASGRTGVRHRRKPLLGRTGRRGGTDDGSAESPQSAPPGSGDVDLAGKLDLILEQMADMRERCDGCRLEREIAMGGQSSCEQVAQVEAKFRAAGRFAGRVQGGVCDEGRGRQRDLCSLTLRRACAWPTGPGCRARWPQPSVPSGTADLTRRRQVNRAASLHLARQSEMPSVGVRVMSGGVSQGMLPGVVCVRRWPRSGFRLAWSCRQGSARRVRSEGGAGVTGVRSRPFRARGDLP